MQPGPVGAEGAVDDAQPQVRWPGGSARRYRDALYLLPDELPESLPELSITGSRLELGVRQQGLYRRSLVRVVQQIDCADQGIAF